MVNKQKLIEYNIIFLGCFFIPYNMLYCYYIMIFKLSINHTFLWETISFLLCFFLMHIYFKKMLTRLTFKFIVISAKYSIIFKPNVLLRAYLLLRKLSQTYIFVILISRCLIFIIILLGILYSIIHLYTYNI